MNILPQKVIIPYSHSLSSSLDYDFGLETRSRTASSSSSFSNMSSSDFPLQSNLHNNLTDINFLIAFLSQSQPSFSPVLSPIPVQSTLLKPSPQLQIPKPIRTTQSSRQIPNNNQQNNMFLEASLNLFSSLILNETTKTTSNHQENLNIASNSSKNSISKSPQQTLLNINQPSYKNNLNFLRNSQTSISLSNHNDDHYITQQSPLPGCINIHNNGSNFQTQIPYQPNIIFGVEMTLEETELRRDHRRAKIEKYLFKKETRRWDVLRYEVRKKIAKTRQRVKGRFVKEEKRPEEEQGQEGKSSVSSGFVLV